MRRTSSTSPATAALVSDNTVVTKASAAFGTGLGEIGRRIAAGRRSPIAGPVTDPPAGTGLPSRTRSCTRADRRTVHPDRPKRSPGLQHLEPQSHRVDLASVAIHCPRDAVQRRKSAALDASFDEMLHVVAEQREAVPIT